MGRKSKISNELRIELIKKILKGKETIKNLAKEYGIAKSSLMTWKKKYLELGEKSVIVDEKNRHYTRKIRNNAVKSYLNNEGSLFEICKKYGITSVSVLNYWIRDYKKSIDENGNYKLLRKHVRKTVESKIEAVTFCQKHNYDYNLTTQKFDISYQQIYSWVRKYETGGAEALVDNRGKRLSERK